MQLFYTDGFVLPLPPGHRFPMARYALLREKLLADGVVSPEELHIPPPASDEELRLVHSADYVDRVTSGRLQAEEIRRIGFPWSVEMVERSRRSVGATIAATAAALGVGVGVNLAGGTHHASADRGSGYCVFNDVAVAIGVQRSAHNSTRRCFRYLIIDADVHHGDGTARIFANDEAVVTTSIHARKAFPVRKPPSNFDIPLEPACDDESYLAGLQQLLGFAETQTPYNLVYYLAGADPYSGDTLGGLNVSQAGLAERDRRVFTFCRAQRLPVVIVMAGGYAKIISEIVDIQARTIQLAKEILQPNL